MICLNAELLKIGQVLLLVDTIAFEVSFEGIFEGLGGSVFRQMNHWFERSLLSANVGDLSR